MVFSIVSDKSLLLFSVVIITRAFCAMTCKEVNSNKPTRKSFLQKNSSLHIFNYLTTYWTHVTDLVITHAEESSA